ncbi:MAG: tRNA (adenosine(37)-N6)-threonylcarbamoyltransferase complex ATPase subunit type 1 TsaE [Patescibacteria group bacterium]
MERYFAGSPAETRKIGEKLAKKLLKTKLQKNAFVLGLKGDLGGGKTTFLQGFAKGLGSKEKILSPTFVIMKKFVMLSKSNFQKFYHFDCYRISGEKDISVLGFEKIVSDPQNIVAVEWAEKIRKVLPKGTVWIKFDFVSDKKREITLL